jgi:predicted GNAT superfamily acetyltransferase
VLPISRDLEPAILALNNAHAVALSWLEPDRFTAMLSDAFYARCIGEAEAFLLAFDKGAAYDSANFQWFRRRYERFVYIDRVVVAGSARRRGHARLLYEELFCRAASAGRDLVVRGECRPTEPRIRRVPRRGRFRGSRRSNDPWRQEARALPRAPGLTLPRGARPARRPN